MRSFRVNRSTNQLMCRDLNGRRVATVEEEKKLRQWLAKAAEREKKKLDKKFIHLVSYLPMFQKSQNRKTERRDC